MTRRANHTITQSVPTPLHPPVVSPSHLRDRLVDKHVANPLHHPLQRQEVLLLCPVPAAEVVDRRAEADPEFKSQLQRLVDDAKQQGLQVGSITQSASGDKNVQNARIQGSSINVSHGTPPPTAAQG